jgi:hypothetical protein
MGIDDSGWILPRVGEKGSKYDKELLSPWSSPANLIEINQIFCPVKRKSPHPG